MGFLGGLFQKKRGVSSGNTQTDLLIEKLEANPKDARVAHELAVAMKAQGDVSGAIIYALQAAGIHKDGGFLQKALSELKLAQSWGSPTAELLSELADVHLAMKHKEDARGMLIKLRDLHVKAGNMSELSGVDKKIAELGPGR
jgi:hypothetical protein